MKRTLILAFGGLAATLVALSPASAQYGRWNDRGWRTVGYTRVDGRDSDTIALPGSTRQREFASARSTSRFTCVTLTYASPMAAGKLLIPVTYFGPAPALARSISTAIVATSRPSGYVMSQSGSAGSGQWSAFRFAAS